MKFLIPVFTLIPILSHADKISNIYWSTYACETYIYHFDNRNNKYEIYTRLDAEDKKRGKYKSYQLTEGKMQFKEKAKYLLTSKEIDYEMVIDFNNINEAILSSTQFGKAFLIQCDTVEAKKLIHEAKRHFKTCPKNVLNCKSL